MKYGGVFYFSTVAEKIRGVLRIENLKSGIFYHACGKVGDFFYKNAIFRKVFIVKGLIKLMNYDTIEESYT